MPCPHFWRASATRSISARKLLWALLDRIMSRPKPGRALSSRLRCPRLGAHQRRGRRDDQPFVPCLSSEPRSASFPPSEGHRRTPRSDQPAQASRGKREPESDPRLLALDERGGLRRRRHDSSRFVSVADGSVFGYRALPRVGVFAFATSDLALDLGLLSLPPCSLAIQSGLLAVDPVPRPLERFVRVPERLLVRRRAAPPGVLASSNCRSRSSASRSR